MNSPSISPPTPRRNRALSLAQLSGAKVQTLACGCRVTVAADGAPLQIHENCPALAGYFSEYLGALEENDQAGMEHCTAARWSHVQAGLDRREGGTL